MNAPFFTFRRFENDGERMTLSRTCVALGEADSYAADYLGKAIKDFPTHGRKTNIVLAIGMPEHIIGRLGEQYAEHDESYAIEVGEDVALYAMTSRGLIYAVSTLIQLVRSDCITDALFLFDYPDKDVRGYRVYIPGRDQIGIFKEMIDTLIYYKYNSVIIEVGGALEYKRHPEINEKWVEFCREISVSPDVADRIQCFTYPWRKDSIHFDNGAGSFITQEEMRDIVNYCKERQLTVIPEVPTLSHSDYIVMAYPELSERVEDKYPDTYCPSNPKTYEIVFDILDEVIDVFDPEYLNIGHDEYYSSAKCELCKHKKAHDIYVEDVTKLHDYLAAKGVETFMWGDAYFADMLRVNSKGKLVPCGGAAEPDKDVAALYECRDKMPRDITLLHWYWTNSSKEEEILVHDLGYKMLFGNFNAVDRKDYRELAHLYNGGFVSNWGSPEEKYMQRNLQNYSLVNTAYVFWSKDYTNEDAPALKERVREELYRTYKSSLGESTIEVCHTTSVEKRFTYFWCGVFIVDSDWLLGYHTVIYTDGTEAKLPVIYGYNIRGSEKEANADQWEAVGASYPFVEGDKVWYRAAYANPHPDKKIDRIEFCKACEIKQS